MDDERPPLRKGTESPGFLRVRRCRAFEGMGHLTRLSFSYTPLPDVDIVYFDVNDTRESTELGYERMLMEKDGTIPWSVKNQARMHAKSGFPPFVSTADGIAHFPETCTAIGACIDAEGNVHLIAPYGLNDLCSLIVRPTPYFSTSEKIHIYRNRVKAKQWQKTWHRLKID